MIVIGNGNNPGTSMRRIPRFLLLTICGLCGGLLTGILVAAPAERPCRDDIMQHCSDRIGQREQMRQCVRANVQKFSEQCQTTLRERRRQNADAQRRKTEQKPATDP